MGVLSDFLSNDHRRLEGVLERATATGDTIDAELFEQFRAGLLRHIGIEEKILLPAAQRAHGGVPLPLARQLRLDHGAIAAMLVPTPSARGVRRLRALLEAHDALEEGPQGVYSECDALLGVEAAAVLKQAMSYPPVRTAPHNDGPFVEKHIADTLKLAGREPLIIIRP
jgi:hypothetical protein